MNANRILLRAGTALLCALALSAGAGVSVAGKHASFAARAGVDPAQAAARVWADDASLVYLENDEELSETGGAPRWGYLFYSPSLQAARSYSVRDGRIVVAENLDMKFEAPPLASGWIDSDAALAVAEEHAGREFRRKSGGRLGTMLLSRGAFQPGAPDLTTWTIVYTAPDAPSLFVVVDAAKRSVCRTWRG